MGRMGNRRVPGKAYQALIRKRDSARDRFARAAASKVAWESAVQVVEVVIVARETSQMETSLVETSLVETSLVETSLIETSLV